METALQELLDEIKECRNIETDLLLPFIRNKIQAKLPKEREQIEQAYDTGAIEMYDIDATARNYFNQTYKEHGK
jgi:hypothetical protein